MGLKDSHKNLSEEHKNLQKQHKAIQKSADQVKADRDQAKAKMKTIETDFEAYKANNLDRSLRITELEAELSKMTSKHESSNQTLEDLRSRLNAANEKFRLNQKDTKVWRHKIEELNKTIKVQEQKLTSSQHTTTQLKTKLADLTDTEEQLIQMKATLKGNEKEIKRLTKDCAYWEKQHYDTHHKLAASLDEIEAFKGKVVSAQQENQGHIAKMTTMKKDLADIKKKLIYANERYHNMN